MTGKIRVLLLGSNGMLGSELVSTLNKSENIVVLGCDRKQLEIDNFGKYKEKFGELVTEFRPDYIINCIGINMKSRKLTNIVRQLNVNGLFPRFLVKQSKYYGYFLIHISTDGVFFGKKGGYIESDFRFPRSIYSLSKILGEKISGSVLIIRCSIIGKTPKGQNSPSLFSWFENLKQNSVIYGYSNQKWNGTTTKFLSKSILGIILAEYRIGGVQHFIPANVISKTELLEFFRIVLRRADISIRPSTAKKTIRRDLNTKNPETNKYLWILAGLDEVPSISNLVHQSFAK